MVHPSDVAYPPQADDRGVDDECLRVRCSTGFLILLVPGVDALPLAKHAASVPIWGQWYVVAVAGFPCIKVTAARVDRLWLGAANLVIGRDRIGGGGIGRASASKQ